MDFDRSVLPRLEQIEREREELSARMADSGVASNPALYRELATRFSEIEPIVNAHRELKRVRAELADAESLAASETDEELLEMAREESLGLSARNAELVEELQRLMLPKDPNADKNVILEIRAGTGGDEASLFAAELMRMYERFAESCGWQLKLVEASESEVGGLKEGIANVSGEGVYARLKFESGVHRVQRVPATESQGRIHTSAATVAVLPEPDEVEVEIDEDKELRLDSFSASGPGGQHVNRTASAVRITHLPSGIVVQCQDEKSWHKNRTKALKVLRARLFDVALREQQEKESEARRGKIGSGDRSEKIRTYNFPQSRVTDHRINLTLHSLEKLMAGELDPLVDALEAAEASKRLEAEAASAESGSAGD